MSGDEEIIAAVAQSRRVAEQAYSGSEPGEYSAAMFLAMFRALLPFFEYVEEKQPEPAAEPEPPAVAEPELPAPAVQEPEAAAAESPAVEEHATEEPTASEEHR